MKKFVYTVLSFAPALALAQSLGGIPSLVSNIGNLFRSILPVLYGLAILYFFWGLIQFIRNSGDEKAQGAGKSMMIYGILALFVMVAINGILVWLGGTLGIQQGGSVTLPVLPQ